MKIVRLIAENIKRLKIVDITPPENLVIVAGPNANGKSSLLDSITYALTGTKSIPSDPIRHGETTAKIRLDLGEVIVTRKFTPSGSTLTLEAASGARFPSPQKMLDDLIQSANGGDGLSFDPLAFSRAKAKDQLEILKGLVKLEFDIDALDGLNVRDYDARAEVNRELKRVEGQIAGIPSDNLPSDVIIPDESALLAKMTQASEHNLAIGQLKQGKRSAESSIAKLLEEIAATKERLAKLEAEVSRQRDHILDYDVRLSESGEVIDTAALAHDIQEAKRVNQLLSQRDHKRKLLDQKVILEAQSQSLTDAMAERLRQKESAIANAKMPIAGLTFGQNELMYNGIPFAQCSQAEQLVVSTVIAIALNPRLKIVRISDGSLLDDNSMALLAKIAEKSGAQLWVECIKSDSPLAIHIQDGSVVVKQEPVRTEP